jgi:hypothetical protein
MVLSTAYWPIRGILVGINAAILSIQDVVSKIYTIKAKVVSGVVTFLVSILPSNKTPNYPPLPLIYIYIYIYT